MNLRQLVCVGNGLLEVTHEQQVACLVEPIVQCVVRNLAKHRMSLRDRVAVSIHEFAQRGQDGLRIDLVHGNRGATREGRRVSRSSIVAANFLGRRVPHLARRVDGARRGIAPRKSVNMGVQRPLNPYTPSIPRYLTIKMHIHYISS